ncbi:MAG: hypothetical protein J0I57_04110 [Hyphomicrobium sp.]|jgi:hypothetical protein|nr:hypothetical protein [Hyphomicrobium sp.]MBN9276800.1 hypothetical protein [Hyphomicrobium sp.]OJU30533.1 MAG: hypothetical protein BGN89_14485 [Alphaproteobacteria bacterium 64-6]
MRTTLVDGVTYVVGRAYCRRILVWSGGWRFQFHTDAETADEDVWSWFIGASRAKGTSSLRQGACLEAMLESGEVGPELYAKLDEVMRGFEERGHVYDVRPLSEVNS